VNRAVEEYQVAIDSADQIGIICACPEGFESTWMPRHQVMTRLAKRFWTIWLEPAHNWRQLPGNISWPKSAQEPGYDRFLRYYPGFLPVIFRPRWLGSFVETLRLRHAARELRKRGCSKIFLYIWRPQFAHYAKLVSFDRCIYHIDDEYTFSDSEADIPPIERQLILHADHVIIHSPALLEKKGDINPATTLVPNGVDYELFSATRAEPDDLRSIPVPRAGYVGVVKKQLDLALLTSLARRRHNVSFVLVGPRGTLGSDEATLDKLVAMPNVHELGNKNPGELGAYMQHMDVLLMCYKNNDYTKYIYPLKLHEYLATGRPAIATPIRTVQNFSNVVMLANSEDEWLSSLDNALSSKERHPSRVDERKSTAKDFDWDLLVDKISRILENLA